MIFSLKLNITPDILDTFPFYRFEMILKAYEEYIEEENKRNKSQEGQYEKQYKSSQTKYKQPSTPKVGGSDYGGFKIPNVNIPKISMPSIKM